MKKGMKRSAAAMLVAGVLFVPAGPALPATAAFVPQPALVPAAAVATDISASQEDEAAIRSLTLEQAIERALEVDSNYKILEYTWKQLNLQQEDLEDRQEELEEEIDDREDEENQAAPSTDMNETTNGGEETADTGSGSDVWSPTPDELGQMIEDILKKLSAPTVDDLEYQRDQLEKNIDQLGSQKNTTRLQQEEAREGVKMLVTQQYVGLLSMKQQVMLAEASLRQQEQAVANSSLKYQLGLISLEAHEKELRNLEDARRNAENLKIQHNKLLAQFLFLLDLPFDPDFQLVAVTPEPQRGLQPPDDIESLVENSFKVRQAKEAVKQAKLELEFAEEHDDEDDFADTTKEEQLEYGVKIAEERLKQTEQNVRAQIDNLFRDAADAQAAYKLAEKKWQDVAKDYERMLLRYELGLISKQDLDNFDLAVRQALTQMEAAKNKYFLALAQLKALEAGYVATNVG
jgi:hypothetical protein